MYNFAAISWYTNTLGCISIVLAHWVIKSYVGPLVHIISIPRVNQFLFFLLSDVSFIILISLDHRSNSLSTIRKVNTVSFTPLMQLFIRTFVNCTCFFLISSDHGSNPLSTGDEYGDLYTTDVVIYQNVCQLHLFLNKFILTN